MDKDRNRVGAEELANLLDPKVYPDGKIDESDEGVLSLQIGHLNGQVVVRFTKPIL